MTRLDLGEEGDAAFLDHLAMPGGLHEGNPLRLIDCLDNCGHLCAATGQ